MKSRRTGAAIWGQAQSRPRPPWVDRGRSAVTYFSVLNDMLAMQSLLSECGLTDAYQLVTQSTHRDERVRLVRF